jgi:hypothetical protein
MAATPISNDFKIPPPNARGKTTLCLLKTKLIRFIRAHPWFKKIVDHGWARITRIRRELCVRLNIVNRRRWILAVVLCVPGLVAMLIGVMVHRQHLYHHIDLASLNYPFDETRGRIQDIPKSLRDLDGKNVSVDGYMIPLDQAEKITSFAIIPVLFGDPWPPPPKLQQVVVCNTPSGVTLAYMPTQIRVYGRLHVAVEKDGGFIVDLYHLDVARVQSLEPFTLPRSVVVITIGAAAMLLVLTARWALRRRKRRLIGHCVACGYDLRATPERCPECGLVPKGAVST